MEETLKDICDRLRAACKKIEVEARRIPDLREFKEEQAYIGQHGEMIAQSKLAVRHLEDARMRFGKVLQYADDGISIYDKV